jgi:hypothetical protein
MAMQGFIASNPDMPKDCDKTSEELAARACVIFADALIAELSKESEKQL